MSKTLYSLMLSEEVVREIDKLAHRRATNRSSLINTIIAEYVHITTPEGRINEILSGIEERLAASGDFITQRSRSSTGLEIRSNLPFKYHPSVRYELSLSKGGENLGELTVGLRTQSGDLIEKTDAFFELLRQIETRSYASMGLQHRSFSPARGRYSRSLHTAQCECSCTELADTISDYISLLDKLFKAYLAGSIDAPGLENAYCSYLFSAYIHI